MVTISATNLSSRNPPTAQAAPSSRRTRILKSSVRALTLLLAVVVACTTGSGLRRRRRIGASSLVVDGVGTAAKRPRSPSDSDSASGSASDPAAPPPASAPEEGPPASAAAAAEEEEASASVAAPVPDPRPSLSLDRSAYVEGESITATFSVGPSSHPYYSSRDAPSPRSELDFDDYARWSVGLFMRDADPQGGTLEPIVRIDACSALGDGDGGCDAGDEAGDDRDDYARYGDLTVAFGSEHLEIMQGRWPLEISEYGTRFDAYVLDGRGVPAIGPLEFVVREDGDDVPDDAAAEGEGPAVYRWSAGAGTPPAPEVPPDPDPDQYPAGSSGSGPLLRYRKGTTKATGRKHAGVAVAPPAPRDSVHVAKAHGSEASSQSIVPSDGSVRRDGGTTGPSSRGAVASDKKEYEEGDPVAIRFSLEPSGEEDFAGYGIGVFMRAAGPRGGAHAPVVSLPLCPATGDDGDDDGGCAARSGSVTFGPETAADMTPAPQWPIDVRQWGTGFGAYVLDGDGAAVAGPAEFDIVGRRSDAR